MILMLLPSRRRTPTELVSAIPRDSYSAKNAGLVSRCCTIAPRNVVHRFLYPPVAVLLRNRYTGWVYTNARYGSYELVVYTLGSLDFVLDKKTNGPSVSVAHLPLSILLIWNLVFAAHPRNSRACSFVVLTTFSIEFTCSLRNLVWTISCLTSDKIGR